MSGPVAQWITRLPTEQKIAGSIPAWIVNFLIWIIFTFEKSLTLIFYVISLFKFKTQKNLNEKIYFQGQKVEETKRGKK